MKNIKMTKKQEIKTENALLKMEIRLEVLREIKRFRMAYRGVGIPRNKTLLWLCNQLGYIDAMLYILGREKLRNQFDKIYQKLSQRLFRKIECIKKLAEWTQTK